MFFIRSLRESWKRISVVVMDSIGIMVIIISYILFFSLFGFALFNDSQFIDPAGYFLTIPHTIFSVYVLFTTSNFPDILFPYWKVNNLSGIFFIGFLLMGLYMLLNLMLAVFYNSYKHQIERKIEKYDNMRHEFLKKEFESIQSEYQNKITTDEFRMKYGDKLINGSDKVVEIIKNIENEYELGVSDGFIYFQDFSYMYMFLEFKKMEKFEKKKRKVSVKKVRRSTVRGSEEKPLM